VVNVTIVKRAKPVMIFCTVVGAPSATNPLNMKEIIISPTTMAITGCPYFLKAKPKKVPINGVKFLDMDAKLDADVIDVP
jgi:hypothetical protein